MSELSIRRLGHYDLIEKIGSGGMSEVWRALDTRLGREVAVKLLPPAEAEEAGRLDLLRSEARALAALNHPNIVIIHAIEEAEGLPFLTMELVRGQTLRDINSPGGMELDSFFEIAQPLASALSAAHKHGIVHGDLKPSNVMINESGILKILDFGLARFLGRPISEAAGEDTTQTLDRDGRVTGTLHYMSPEQLQGRSVDARSDIYSLGVICHEMLAGRPPFSGDSAAELIAAILRDAPESLFRIKPNLPRHLARIIGRTLEKDPARRIRTALDFEDELGAIRKAFGRKEGGHPNAIGVLPFSDLSPEKNQDYFCEGIAEAIINTLSRVGNLRVAARASSFRFKNTVMDSREIGDRLGVGVLLSGRVRKAEHRLRITAELTDVSGGFLLWSDHYDRELADIFAIQDEIARAIVAALEPRLEPGENQNLKGPGTSNVQAYDFYLRGRSFYHQHRRRGIEFALQMFNRAVAVDPEFAPAHAGIADCHSYLYLNLDRSDSHRLNAEEAGRRALELDPNLAEAHASAGLALSLHGRHAEAGVEFEEAVKLNSRLFEAYYYYARDLFIQGRFEDALKQYEAASEIRPDDYQSPLLSAQIYEDLGRRGEARAARLRGVRLAEERLDYQPDDIRALYTGANGLVALGDKEKGLDWAARALDIEPDEPMILYNLACIYALADETARALNCLEKAVDLGFSFRQWLEKDSNLDSLRDHPRFRAVLELLGCA